MLFGNLFRTNRPALPLYGYLTASGQLLLLRTIGGCHHDLVVLFGSRHVAEQRLQTQLRGSVRIVELTSPASVASHLRHSGAARLSIDPEPLCSEPGCYSDRRTDCPVRLSEALAALDTPPPAAGESPSAMFEPASRRAATTFR